MPLYQQIFLILQRRIRSGEIPAGTYLPGEEDLSAEFGVSRITGKRALKELADVGLVARERGRGTRVLEIAWQGPVRASIDGWLENISQMGRNTSVNLLSFDYRPAGKQVAEALEIEEDAIVQRSVRVRRLGKEPMSYLVTHVPEDVGRSYDAKAMADQPLLQLLENAGVTVASARQAITAVAADATLADALNVHTGATLLQVIRVVRDANDRPIEHLDVRYRPELYSLDVAMRRVKGENGMTWHPDAAATVPAAAAPARRPAPRQRRNR